MHKSKGFTLIELLIVMAILGMLAALVGPALFKNLGKGKQSAAKSQISMLGSALDSYRLDVGKYPRSLEGLARNNSGKPTWDGPYLKGDTPKDPWGAEYIYQSRGKDYKLMSYGADGAQGGQGDDADIGR